MSEREYPRLYRPLTQNVVVREKEQKTSTTRSATMKVLWQDPQYREKVISGLRAYWDDPLVLALNSNKVSVHITAAWQREEYRQNKIARLIETHQSDEYIRNASIRHKELWQDPEYRATTIKGIRKSRIKNRKTHCKNGHPRTKENVGANRDCKICRAVRGKECRRRRAAKLLYLPPLTRGWLKGSDRHPD
jgi:hypothetical protein